MKITIDIDKPFNEKSINPIAAKLNEFDLPTMGKIFRRSAHDRIHLDLKFYEPDTLGSYLEGKYDFHTIADMYLLIVRLALNDDIRRLRTDAAKFLMNQDIYHWLPSKEDYEKMRDGNDGYS